MKIIYLAAQKMEGMRKYFLIALLILSSVSLTGAQNQKIKIACIGNSITYGSGMVSRDTLSYPGQLQFWMGKDYEVRNFGVSGATLLRKGDKPYQNESQYEDVKAYQPDIILIMLGTNDSKPQNWKYASEFESDYSQMIKELKELPSNPRILLAQPTPVFVEEKWGINQRILKEEINPKIEALAKKHSLELLDLYTPLLNAGAYFPDQVHPDPIAASLIVKQVYIKLFHRTSANRGKAFNAATFAVPNPEYRSQAAGWGEGSNWFKQHHDILRIKDDMQTDLVFLGNSITQNWGGKGRTVGSTVAELWDSLYAPRNAVNFGISGDRTQHILWRIENGMLDGIQPKALVLTIGVNNFPHNTPEEIAAGIRLIVEKTRKKLPKTRIILIGPLPAGMGKDDTLRKKYEGVHSNIRSLNLLQNVHYLKIDEPFILENGQLNKHLMKEDGIHLTPAGYHAWATLMEPVLSGIFDN